MSLAHLSFPLISISEQLLNPDHLHHLLTTSIWEGLKSIQYLTREYDLIALHNVLTL